MISTSPKALGFTVALLVAGGALYARHVGSSRRAARAAVTLSAAVAHGDLVLRVPHLSGTITLDGDMDDPGWTRPPGPASTGAFLLPNGNPAVPHSRTRLVWSGEYLYMALYASDEDIKDDDAFRIVFSQEGKDYTLNVSPKGVITGSVRGTHASNEIDGTINNPKDMDEEWAIELAVPFESLGMRGERGENIGMTLSRCDTPKDGTQVCAGWPANPGRGRIVLE